MRFLRGPWLLAALATLAACDDFAPPSALSKEQIIAVRATPASIEPGTEAVLDALVAGPSGEVDAELHWELVDPPAGLTLDTTVDPVRLIAAADTAATAAIVRLEVAANGAALTAFKTVGLDTRRDNPALTELSIGGDSGLAGDAPISVPVDTAIGLRLAIDRPGELRVSWFVTAGEIELYRRTPSELVTPVAPGPATLFAVARDQTGGVTWGRVDLIYR